jgi:hypothetical protein
MELFEDHYLSCPECLDRLELAESLQRGFKRMAGQEAATLVAARQLALVAWLARLGRSRQMAVLVMALLVFAILPAGFVVHRVAGHDQELAQTRSALERERQRSSTEARSAAEATRKLSAELAASRQDAAGAREARAHVEQQLAQASQPEGNFPIVFLNVERGAGPAGEEPTQRVRRPAAGRIILTPAIDPPFQPSYRAVLRDRQGHEIWRWQGLQPNERDELSLSVPVSLIPPGDYSLSVEGIMPGAKPKAAGRFTFRVTPG